MEKKITGEMLQEYREYLIEEERQQATIEKYMRDIRKFYRFLPAGKCVDKASVVAYKNQLLNSYQPASVNSMLAAVNGFLTFSRCGEFRVRQIKIQRQLFCRQEKELTRADYLRLVQAAKKKGNERLDLIIQTICATGIRVSELPYITTEAVRIGYADVSCKNKTRRIFLAGKLQHILKGYIRKKKIRRGPVFVTKNNRDISRSNIWREMKILSKAAGVAPEKVFPHNLRHLFAVTYYKQKKDIVKLADILGHSSIETARIYTVTSGREHMLHLERMGLVITDL